MHQNNPCHPSESWDPRRNWIPVFAGMTLVLVSMLLSACQHQKGNVPFVDNRDKFYNDKLTLVVRQGDNTLFVPSKECANNKFVIQNGDSLGTVARLCGTTVPELAQANNMTQPYRLQIGQVITVPTTALSNSLTEKTSIVTSFSEGYRDSYHSSRKEAVSAIPAGKPLPELPAYRPAQNEIAVSQLPDISTHSGLPASLPNALPAKSAPVESTPAVTTTPAPQAETPPLAITAVPEKKSEPVKEKESDSFAWPVQGEVVTKFGDKKDGVENDGISIAASAGDSVKASRTGTVVYTGNALKGYGNMVILRHEGGWLTAYSHLKQANVKIGQAVKQGEVIGTVGTTGYVSKPQLHFVIRQGKQAVDPLAHLG